MTISRCYISLSKTTNEYILRRIYNPQIRIIIEYGMNINYVQKREYFKTTSGKFNHYGYTTSTKQTFITCAFASWISSFSQQSTPSWTGIISKDEEETFNYSKPMTIISCVNGEPHHLEHRDTSISNGFLEPSKGDNYIPPLDAYGCGDDAALAMSKILCVADGVGGWHSTPGGNPALYSRTLCHNILHNIKAALSSFFYLQDDQLYELIHISHKSIDQVMGSTTLSMAIINQSTSHAPEWLLYNIGDSGIFIIRKGQVVYRSNASCHRFNCPFQLGSKSKDTSRDGDIDRLVARPGDLALLSTDGLLDNVSDEEILSIVNQYMELNIQNSSSPKESLLIYKSLNDMTNHLVRTAYNKFSDGTGTGHVNGRFQGVGKPDDITVVAGVLTYE